MATEQSASDESCGFFPNNTVMRVPTLRCFTVQVERRLHTAEEIWRRRRRFCEGTGRSGGGGVRSAEVTSETLDLLRSAHGGMAVADPYRGVQIRRRSRMRSDLMAAEFDSWRVSGATNVGVGFVKVTRWRELSMAIQDLNLTAVVITWGGETENEAVEMRK